jgi:glutathione synthase/RimK-type ligase-like ATP-grasp enzyme
VVVNHPSQVLKALDRVRFPLVVKANVGGSGAGIARYDSREELEPAIERLPLGPDGTALVQEYIESLDGAIVRVEVMDGRYLYAIRIVRQADAGFNLCPADICQTPGAAPPGALAAAAVPADLSACPAESPGRPGLTVSAYDPPGEAIETAVRIARAASIDVGGIEYLVSRANGHIYYYDVNATSNFVANAPAVLGFDPTARFADFILRVALCNPTVPAALTPSQYGGLPGDIG